MRQKVLRIVEAYIDAVRANNVDDLPLHADIVFESPLNTIRGIPAFRKGMASFVRILSDVEINQLVADDDSCAAVLTLHTIFGPVPFLELFRIADESIISIRAYYDPRPILEGISRMAPT